MPALQTVNGGSAWRAKYSAPCLWPDQRGAPSLPHDVRRSVGPLPDSSRGATPSSQRTTRCGALTTKLTSTQAWRSGSPSRACRSASDSGNAPDSKRMRNVLVRRPLSESPFDGRSRRRAIVRARARADPNVRLCRPSSQESARPSPGLVAPWFRHHGSEQVGKLKLSPLMISVPLALAGFWPDTKVVVCDWLAGDVPNP